MTGAPRKAPATAVQTFARDGAPPLRAKAEELRRAEMESPRDGLSARFALWRRDRAAGGWIATVELRRGGEDGAALREVFAEDDADRLLDALEAWRPRWPEEEAETPYGAELAQARLARFYALALGETLADWC